MVADTLSVRGKSHSSSNRWTTVDFPAPEGPEMMINLPNACVIITTARPSLHVLDEFAHLLNNRLDGHDIMGHGCIVGF